VDNPSVSFAAYEHVHRRSLERYFPTLRRLPGDLVLNHGIARCRHFDDDAGVVFLPHVCHGVANGVRWVARKPLRPLTSTSRGTVTHSRCQSCLSSPRRSVLPCTDFGSYLSRLPPVSCEQGEESCVKDCSRNTPHTRPDAHQN